MPVIAEADPLIAHCHHAFDVELVLRKGGNALGLEDDDLAALRVAEVVTHPVHEEVVAADDLEFEDVVAFAELLAVLQL